MSNRALRQNTRKLPPGKDIPQPPKAGKPRFQTSKHGSQDASSSIQTSNQSSITAGSSILTDSSAAFTDVSRDGFDGSMKASGNGALVRNVDATLKCLSPNFMKCTLIT